MSINPGKQPFWDTQWPYWSYLHTKHTIFPHCIRMVVVCFFSGGFLMESYIPKRTRQEIFIDSIDGEIPQCTSDIEHPPYLISGMPCLNWLLDLISYDLSWPHSIHNSASRIPNPSWFTCFHESPSPVNLNVLPGNLASKYQVNPNLR